MPWHIENNNPGCSGYAVVKDDDGTIAGCHKTREEAEDQLAALYANENTRGLAEQQGMSRLEEVRDFVREVDRTLERSFPFQVEEVRDSGAGGGVYTVKGHAAVFGKWSLDLGGFRERIKKGAFDNVLSKDPHVLHVWDHDTTRALSSTRSTTYPLELRVDPQGLHFYSKVAPTSYSEDLRVLLDGGVITQSSFAFTVARDEWRITEDDHGTEHVERTIVEVDELFDVTTCALGAYPTTDSALALRSLSLGRRPAKAGATEGVVNAASSTEGRSGAETENAPDSPAVEPRAADEAAKPKPERPEDREAREREHEKWRLRLLAEHRRTREFAFGVNHTDERGTDR